MENKEYKAKIEKLENLIKLMKLQIERPNTQFQWFYAVEHEWIDCKISPSWITSIKYRIKPLK